MEAAFSLDFTTASLDPRVSFSRTTGASNPASYVASNGLIVSATNNQPRFDFDPVTLACRGLLIEESKSNILTFSEVFNTNWTAARVSIGSDAAIAPSGTQSADKIIEDSTTNSHLIYQAVTYSSGVAYTASVYLKKAERNYAWIMFPIGNGFAANYGISIDLTTGAVSTSGATAPTSYTVENSGNGWWRVSITATTNATSGRSAYIGTGTSHTVFQSYLGDGSSGVYVWGAQLEAGASATSYIRTVGTSLTRNADIATITGPNFSDWWQAGIGGVTARARPSTVVGTRPWLQFDDGTVDNLIALRGNTTNPELYIKATTDQAQIDAGTIAANTTYSLTGWWQTNDCKARLDSGAAVVDTSATIPTVTQARLGSDGTNYLNGHLASIAYYDVFSSRIYTRRKNKVVSSLL